MPSLEDAIAFAAKAHEGQTDKAGQPYILHPLQVMLKMNNAEERIVAILHDVIEDTRYSLEDLKNLKYTDNVIRAIDLLTHKEGQDYFDYVRNCRINPLARKVKEADAIKNMDLTRIILPKEKDFTRVKKYATVIEMLNWNKSFYESAEYSSLSEESRISLENLFKVLDTIGIEYITEFEQSGLLSIKERELPNRTILFINISTEGLELKNPNMESKYNVDKESILAENFVDGLKELISVVPH